MIFISLIICGVLISLFVASILYIIFGIHGDSPGEMMYVIWAVFIAVAVFYLVLSWLAITDTITGITFIDVLTEGMKQ